MEENEIMIEQTIGEVGSKTINIETGSTDVYRAKIRSSLS